MNAHDLFVKFQASPRPRRLPTRGKVSLLAPGRRSDGAPALGNVESFPKERASDLELARAAGEGDEAAVGLLWERHSHRVRGVLRTMLGVDGATVEDLLQEVFLAFFASAHRIKNPHAARAYLLATASNLAGMELRRRAVRRFVQLSPTGNLPDFPLEPADTDGRAALDALTNILGQLRTRRRLAFVLRYVERLDVVEVAEALGVSESTARRETKKAREFVFSHARRDGALSAYLARPASAGGGSRPSEEFDD
jgi:RNA polymerase sigma-70 factor (ECF subfamily)